MYICSPIGDARTTPTSTGGARTTPTSTTREVGDDFGVDSDFVIRSICDGSSANLFTSPEQICTHRSGAAGDVRIASATVELLRFISAEATPLRRRRPRSRGMASIIFGSAQNSVPRSSSVSAVLLLLLAPATCAPTSEDLVQILVQ